MYIPKLITSQIRYHRCLDKFQLATHTKAVKDQLLISIKQKDMEYDKIWYYTKNHLLRLITHILWHHNKKSAKDYIVKWTDRWND